MSFLNYLIKKSATKKKKFEEEGIRVLTGHLAKEVIANETNKILLCEHNGKRVMEIKKVMAK